MRFAGRLDRLDATATGARVIDYKTGKGATERKRLKDGLSVQLPVYQLAVRQAGERRATGETVLRLYRLVTRRGGFEELPLPDGRGRRQAASRAWSPKPSRWSTRGLFPRSTARALRLLRRRLRLRRHRLDAGAQARARRCSPTS